ncbi:MAG: DUF1549 domain-containing protein, partial [Planctomycetota bacterium]|nr:DUF1549 domain-containing protein [Planctomycetota bacterium]
MRHVALVLAALVLAAPGVLAKPAHKRSLKKYYGDLLPPALHDCTTCHVKGAADHEEGDEPPPHNAFGARLREIAKQLRQPGKGKGRSLATRLELVRGEDADGDGVPNELEILAGHAPGDGNDTPDAEEVRRAREVLRGFRASQGYRWRPFERLERPAVPQVRRWSWVRNPVDAFVARAHEEKGLEPRPEAPPHVLLRRLYLDLVGLPPSREERRAFLQDPSPDAHERLVDRLLASPRHGERWGRHWMDIWRYSDWAGWGKQVRDSQPHIWRWRDWIVASLNHDQGYDRMLLEMLAADELHPEDPEQLEATGFLVRNYKRLSREKWLQDTVDHTAKAFLGVTLGCARCHDHRYDPISQEEYYRVRAIFEPHEVRIDRLPGEPDTARSGLPRVYDAKLDARTYLYVRGDDRQPDKERPLAPGVPAALGGPEFRVSPVRLPLTASVPDKRPFVIRETLAASRDEIEAARAARDKLLQKAAATDEEKRLAELDVRLTEMRHASLEATLRVERLEDEGVVGDESADWKKAATAAAAAQRRLALVEAERGELAARRQVEKAQLA